MKKLQMTFVNADLKTTRYTPNGAREDMTAEEVRKVMDEIISLDFFVKNGVKQCTGIGRARYVETIETMLFDEL